MDENERRSIFRSLMVPKFIPSRPKEDSDDSSMCGSSPLPIFWTNPTLMRCSDPASCSSRC